MESGSPDKDPGPSGCQPGPPPPAKGPLPGGSGEGSTPGDVPQIEGSPDQAVANRGGTHAKLADILFQPNQLNGPLGLLDKCMLSKAKVLVVTRHKKGIRGVCTGIVVAFDRHMNLILRDVDEQYTVLSKAPEESTGRDEGDGKLLRWKKKLEYFERHLQQVLLRGENIILVSTSSDSSRNFREYLRCR
mmetsp:Transcript_12342/g.31360  ORF Transcript_12342/g.31360 Transcript_12342/m.31360 type:complete len:189 (+) Transcript_12342:32-598(+)